MADLDEVTHIYTAWRKAFQALDVATMKSLFDQEFETLIYQPEEAADAMFSWPEIDAYWDAIPAVVESIPEWREIVRKVIVDGDKAYVYSKLHTKIHLKDVPKPLVGDLRVVLCLNKASAGWGIIGVHESRQLELSDLNR